jgi:hypothetical protein
MRAPTQLLSGGTSSGVESNARLTGALAVVLLVLLAAEGLTILRIRQLIDWHIFFGLLVVPPVLLKIASTGWRFARYYAGSPAYRRKGPPAIILRLLGPVVVVLSVVLLGSGIALILVPTSVYGQVLFVHKASFVLWFGTMAIHVLGHLSDTARLAPRDWARRTRRDVAGAGMRMWAVSLAVVAGLVIGLLTWGDTGTFANYRRRDSREGLAPAAPGQSVRAPSPGHL